MSLFILPTITALIGDPVELGSAFRWVRIDFDMPDIQSPKNGSTVTGGQTISNDLIVNFSGTTLLNQQQVAQAYAEAYAQVLINREIMSIINT